MTTLVWDTSPLWHAALADRLDVLGDLTSGPADSTWQSVTTQTVVAELRRNGIAADLHESNVYALTDFKPRKDPNTERRYLSGSYGAVPILDSQQFAVAAQSGSRTVWL